jgi:hypothetical protein
MPLAVVLDGLGASRDAVHGYTFCFFPCVPLHFYTPCFSVFYFHFFKRLTSGLLCRKESPMALKDIISCYGVGALILLIGDKTSFACFGADDEAMDGMPCIILS